MVYFTQKEGIAAVEGFITDITPIKQTEQALRESEEKYRLLAENVTDLISRHLANGVCLYASAAAEILLGYEPKELVGKSFTDWCHPEDKSSLENFFRQLEQNLGTEPITYRIRHQKGNYIWLETTGKTIIRNSAQKVQEVIAVSRNVTNRLQTEGALKQAEKQYKNIFENISQGIFQSNLNGQYLKVNSALARIYGYISPVELIESISNIETQIYVYPESYRSLASLLENNKKVSNFESQVYCKDGNVIWISENIRNVYDELGHFLYYEGTVEDITYRHQAEAKLLYNAFYDALTGLPNRYSFTEQLENALKTSGDSPNFFYAVLFLDLDGFKVVNDSFGHLVGDELLKQVAHRLKSELRHQDKIARFGGDEFLILLDDIQTFQDVITVAERIKDKIKLPFNLGEENIFTSVSIGITCNNLHYQKPEELLRDADIAMYQAKLRGKSCHVFFNPQMQQAILAKHQLANDLHYALEKQEFCLYYQPIIELNTRRLKGFEALLRWYHPVRGWISPGEFIPLAEETGLIHNLGDWVFRKACRQLQDWQQQYSQAESLVINVNLSVHQLKEIDLVSRIESILTAHNLLAKSIKLEITESAFLETVAYQASTVQGLKELGLGLCIDDFGTGYSSLSRLHEFPVDTLKIDRAFIQALDSSHTAIIQTIITLGQILGMDVVAEGIETQEQMEKLQALKCEYGQGFFFAKPFDSIVASQFITRPIFSAISNF
jgi:diguanylate cyclase (GGDEF)-like protein/PAS domain S-box-containing protein